MKQVDTSPHVSKPLKAAELNSIRTFSRLKTSMAFMKLELHISQEDFEQQNPLILEQIDLLLSN